MANKPTYEELEQRVKELESRRFDPKQTAKQSQSEHSRLMGILESIPGGVYIADKHFNIEYINPVIERDFGKIQGRKCYQYFHDRTESCPWCKNEEVFAGRSVNWEWYSIENDKYYELFDTPFENSDGSISKFEFFHDVTERKRSEEALKRSAERFRRLFEQASDAFFIHDFNDGKILEANECACRNLGYTRDELLELNVSDIEISHTPETIVEICTRAEKGSPVIVEGVQRRKDGSTFPVEISLGMLQDEDPTLLLAIVRDTTERKQTQEALRESEGRFSTMFEHMSSGVAVYESVDNGEDFVFRAFNPEAERITRISQREALGNRLLDLFPHMDKSGLLGVLQRVWKTGQEEHIPPFYYKDEKREGWRENRIYKLPTGEVVALFDDVTESKQAEQALRESEEQYRTLVDNLPVAVYRNTPGPEGQFLMANPAFCKMFGFKNEEEVKKVTPASIYQNPEERKQYSDNLIQKGVFKNDERALQKRDGTPVYTSITSRVYRKDGEISYFDSIMLDITEQKFAKDALQESEEKYRSMMESMKDPIYICSQDYRVEYMNPSMIQRTGHDATGEKCFKALHDLDEKCPWCMHDEAQQPEYCEDDIVSPKDNRSYHVSSSPIAHGDGTISKMTVLRDTTDLKKLETQLQQAQKMEAIGTLAGGIAHDFNNILGGIIGYAELAKMKAPEGSNIIAYLDKMIKSSDRAADLIKQILTLSRRHKQKQRPVQVRHIIKETLSLLRATLPTTIEIRQDLAKDAGVVNADPTQMHQVIMNLATNAGHAMQKDGGVLEVTLANVELDDLSAEKHLDLAAGSYLRLTVSDTGHGMTAEIMERIFDPYFTTKDTGEGTGLGLSVAHGIVKTHGGTITVYSEPGEGTIFHVYLPLILEEEREVKESEEPLPTGTERILFIDDEEALVEIGGQILEQLGYEVVAEKSSVQALELFRAEPDRFDLVITDMTMPHMTGDKLAQALMKIRPQIPIILCTGHSGLVSEEKAQEIGIKAFVMKPLVMRNLAETVRKALDEK